MSKNMVFAWAGDVLVAVHGTQPPTDEEWKPYFDSIKAIKDLSKVRNIAVTEGGAPTSAQRREVNEFFGGRSGLAAVLSTSTMVRGVVTALSWFNPQIKAFSPESKADAFHHLKLNLTEVELVSRTIDRLRLELGKP